MTHAAFDLAEFKMTDAEGGRGLFAALVSVFGNIDRNGDRVLRGAFRRSIDAWRKSGKPIPVIFSHEHNDPNSFIGTVDPADVQETAKGLVVAGKLDIETNPKAAQVWQLLKDGRINQWSFSYDPVGKRIGKDLVRELTDVDLFEVGPTLVGANAETRTLAVKSHTEWSDAMQPLADAIESRLRSRIDDAVEAKVGRVISSKTEERVRAAIAELEDVLAQLGQAEPEPDNTPEVAAEEAVTSEEQAPEPTPAPEVERLQEAERFLAERGRLELAKVQVYLGERNR